LGFELISKLTAFAICNPLPLKKSKFLSITAMFWAFKRVDKNNLSLSKLHVVLVAETEPKTIFPLSDNVNLKLKVLQPSSVKTPSETLSLMPPFGIWSL